MSEHERTKTRINYSAHALVKSGQKGIIKGTIRDIALESLYLYITPLFEIDEKVNVEIVLLGTDSQLSIKVPARVVRKDEKGIALSFLSPLEWWPVFTFFPLHRLDGPSPWKVERGQDDNSR